MDFINSLPETGNGDAKIGREGQRGRGTDEEKDRERTRQRDRIGGRETERGTEREGDGWTLGESNAHPEIIF